MFESAELGCQLSKEEYAQRAAELRESLLQLQGELQECDFPVLIVLHGVEGAGRGETGNLLLEWMDARGIETHAFGEMSEEIRERPRFWRYWMSLPAHGKLGIYLGSWYMDPFLDRIFKRINEDRLQRELDRINEFERMLVRDGALIVKFWLHLSKSEAKNRLKSLEKNPETRWRVTDQQWEFFRLYDRHRSVAEHVLRTTSTEEAPWHVVEATDERYRGVTVATLVRDALRERMQRPAPNAAPAPPLPVPRPVNVINQLDLTKSLERDDYREQLESLQGRLNMLVRKLRETHRSLTLVLEGPDAAGKGGAIRRVTSALDARWYRVISVTKPTQEELAQHYLWRFWRHIPRHGRVTIYDRSWYGRVLVERLEGFAAPEAWRRAFEEINNFEAQLTEAGIILLKFWIAVSEEEQYARFQEREQTPYKQYKIGAEDWRNREKWDAYEAAACEMIERTSTEMAPWTLVEGNHKRWARIKVLRTTCERLEKALKE